MAYVDRRGRWQAVLAAGLVAVAGTQLACGGAGLETDSAAVSTGESAAAARAVALSVAEVARRARVLLTDPEAIGYLDALVSNFGSAAEAIEAAASQLGLELTPGQISQLIDAWLEARRAWLDAGAVSDGAFLAQLAQDLGWLLGLVDQTVLRGDLPPPLALLLDQLRALIATFRDLAEALAQEHGIVIGPGPVVGPGLDIVPAEGSGGASAAPRARSGNQTSWGRSPSRSPSDTGANMGTSAYQQK